MHSTPPPFGIATPIASGLVRVLAPNPGPMTHWGTNSYVIGDDEVAILDPGPDSDPHLAALKAATGDRPVVAILVTHAHRDHSALAPRAAAAFDAPVFAFGPPEAGRSATMQRLAAGGLTGGGEGVDATFRPDKTLGHEATLDLGPERLTALHTPGHFAGHLAFVWGDTILTGDLVMGWASTLISPPDGDVAAFRMALDRLEARPSARLAPGHGPAVDAPQERIRALRAHRAAREGAILDTLADHPATIASLTAAIYTDTPPGLRPAAERNVFAHLIDLEDRNLVTADPHLAPDATYMRL
ncbi:MAG: MBL fold metallo-hydrolase [Pseudomonadota bacterium]